MADHEVSGDTLHDTRHEQSEPISEIDSAVEAPTRNEPSSEATQVPQVDITEEGEAPSIPKKKKKKKKESKSPSSLSTPTVSTLQDTEADSVEQVDAESEVDDVLDQDTSIMSSIVEAECPESSPSKKKKAAAIDPDQPADTPEELIQPSLSADSQPVTMEESQESDGKSPIPNPQANDVSDILIQELEVSAQGPEQSLPTADESLVTIDQSPETQDDTALPESSGPQPVEPKELSVQDHESAQPEEPTASFDELAVVESAIAPEPSLTGEPEVSEATPQLPPTSEDPQPEPKEEKLEVLNVLDRASGSETPESAPSSDLQEMSGNLKDSASENSLQAISEEPNSAESHATETNSTPVESAEQDAEPIDELPQTNEPESAEEIQVKIDELLENQPDHEEQASASAAESSDALPTDGLEVESEAVHQEFQVPETLAPEEVEAPVPSIDVVPESQAEDDPLEKQASDDDTKEPEVSPEEPVPELELPGDAVAENTVQDGDGITESQEAPSLPTETEYTVNEKAPQSPATEDLPIKEEVPIPKSQDDVSEDAAKPDDEHKLPPLETSDTHPVQESDSVPEVSIYGASQEEHITEAPQEQAPLEFTEVSDTNQLDDGKDKEIDNPISAEKLLDIQPQQDSGLPSDSQEPQAVEEAVESPHNAVVELPTIEIPVDTVFEAPDVLVVQAPFEDTPKDHQIDTMPSETVASDGQSFTLPPSDHINLTPSTIQSEFSAIGDEELAAIVRGVIPVESDEAVDEDNSDARTEVAEPVAQLDEVSPETELSNIEMVSDDAQPVNGSVVSDVSPPEETMSEIDVGSIEPKHSLDVESSQEKVEADSELSHQSSTGVSDSKTTLTTSESPIVPQETVPDQLDENKKESKEFNLGAAPTVIQEASALNEATSVDESTPVTEKPVASDVKSITENTSGLLPEDVPSVDVPETPLQDINADAYQYDEVLKVQPFEESKSAQNDSVAAIKTLTSEQKNVTKESVEVNEADDIVDSPFATETKETEETAQTLVDETAAPELVKKAVKEADTEETNVIGVVSTEVEPIAVTEESPLENETEVTVPSTEEAAIKSDANLEPSSSTVEMEQSVDETEPTFSPELKDIDAVVEPKNEAPVLEVNLNEVSSEVEVEIPSAPEVELVVTETQEPASQAEDEPFTSAIEKLAQEPEGPMPVSDIENSSAILTEETFEQHILQAGSELLASPVEDVPVSEVHEAISEVESEASSDDVQDQPPTPSIEDHEISSNLAIEIEAPVKDAEIEVPNSAPEQDGTSLETESETEVTTVDASESEVPAVIVKHEKTISEPENEIGTSTVSAEIEEISLEANVLVETVENELEAPAPTIEDDKMTSEHKSEVEASVPAVENTTPILEAEREVPQTGVEVDTSASKLQAEPHVEAQSEVTTCSTEDKAVIAEPETVVVTPILETEAHKTEAQETAVNPEIVASELELVEVSAPLIESTSNGIFPDDKASQTKEASSLEADTIKEDSDVPEAPTEVTSAEIKDTTEAAKLVVDDSPQDASTNVDNYLEAGVTEPTEIQDVFAAVKCVASVQTYAEDLPVSHEAELQPQDVNNVLEQPEDIVASEESAHLLEPHILYSQASEARGPADDADNQAEKEIESSLQPIAATSTVAVFAATVAAAVASESESAVVIPNNGSEGVSKEEEVPKTNLMAKHNEMRSIKLTDDDVATQEPSLVSEVPIHDEAPAEAAPEGERETNPSIFETVFEANPIEATVEMEDKDIATPLEEDSIEISELEVSGFMDEIDTQTRSGPSHRAIGQFQRHRSDDELATLAALDDDYFPDDTPVQSKTAAQDSSSLVLPDALVSKLPLSKSAVDQPASLNLKAGAESVELSDMLSATGFSTTVLNVAPVTVQTQRPPELGYMGHKKTFSDMTDIDAGLFSPTGDQEVSFASPATTASGVSASHMIELEKKSLDLNDDMAPVPETPQEPTGTEVKDMASNIPLLKDRVNQKDDVSLIQDSFQSETELLVSDDDIQESCVHGSSIEDGEEPSSDDLSKSFISEAASDESLEEWGIEDESFDFGIPTQCIAPTKLKAILEPEPLVSKYHTDVAIVNITNAISMENTSDPAQHNQEPSTLPEVVYELPQESLVSVPDNSDITAADDSLSISSPVADFSAKDFDALALEIDETINLVIAGEPSDDIKSSAVAGDDTNTEILSIVERPIPGPAAISDPVEMTVTEREMLEPPAELEAEVPVEKKEVVLEATTVEEAHADHHVDFVMASSESLVEEVQDETCEVTDVQITEETSTADSQASPDIEKVRLVTEALGSAALTATLVATTKSILENLDVDQEYTTLEPKIHIPSVEDESHTEDDAVSKEVYELVVEVLETPIETRSTSVPAPEDISNREIQDDGVPEQAITDSKATALEVTYEVSGSPLQNDPQVEKEVVEELEATEPSTSVLKDANQDLTPIVIVREPDVQVADTESSEQTEVSIQPVIDPVVLGPQDTRSGEPDVKEEIVAANVNIVIAAAAITTDAVTVTASPLDVCVAQEQSVAEEVSERTVVDSLTEAPKSSEKKNKPAAPEIGQDKVSKDLKTNSLSPLAVDQTSSPAQLKSLLETKQTSKPTVASQQQLISIYTGAAIALFATLQMLPKSIVLVLLLLVAPGAYLAPDNRMLLSGAATVMALCLIIRVNDVIGDESRDENVRYIQYSDLPRTIAAQPPPVPTHQPYNYDGYSYQSYPLQNPPALDARYYHGSFVGGAEGYVSNPDAYILDQQHQAQGNNIVYSHSDPLHQVQQPGYPPSSNSRSNFTGYQYDRLPSSNRRPAHVHQYSHWDINGESKPLQQPKAQSDRPPVAVVFKPSQPIKSTRAPPVVDSPAPSRYVTAGGLLKDPTADDTDFVHVEASSPNDEYHRYHVTTKADTYTKGSSRRTEPRRQHSPEPVSDEDSVEVPPRRSSRKSTKSSFRSHRSNHSSSVPVYPPVSEPEPQTPRDFVEVSTPSSPLDSPEIISTSDAVDPQATSPHIARSIPVDSPPTMEPNSPKKKHISPRKQQPEIAPEIAPAPHVAVSSSKNEAPQRFRPAESKPLPEHSPSAIAMAQEPHWEFHSLSPPSVEYGLPTSLVGRLEAEAQRIDDDNALMQQDQDLLSDSLFESRCGNESVWSGYTDPRDFDPSRFMATGLDHMVPEDATTDYPMSEEALVGAAIVTNVVFATQSMLSDNLGEKRPYEQSAAPSLLNNEFDPDYDELARDIEQTFAEEDFERMDLTTGCTTFGQNYPDSSVLVDYHNAGVEYQSMRPWNDSDAFSQSFSAIFQEQYQSRDAVRHYEDRQPSVEHALQSSPSYSTNVLGVFQSPPSPPPPQDDDSENTVEVPQAIPASRSRYRTIPPPESFPQPQEKRIPSPVMVIPTAADLPPPAQTHPRALRRQKKRQRLQTEEMLAAAFIVYTTAQAFNSPHSPPEEEPDYVHVEQESPIDMPIHQLDDSTVNDNIPDGFRESDVHCPASPWSGGFSPWIDGVVPGLAQGSRQPELQEVLQSPQTLFPDLPPVAPYTANLYPFTTSTSIIGGSQLDFPGFDENHTNPESTVKAQPIFPFIGADSPDADHDFSTETVSFSLDDAPRSKQRRRISDRNQDSSSRKSHKYETRRQPVMPHPIFTGGLPSSRSNSIKGSGNERRQSEFGDPMIARSDSARSHRSSRSSKGRDTPVAKYLDSNIPPSAHESQESSEREMQRLERRRQRKRERETEQKCDEDRRHRSIRRSKGKGPMVASSLDSPVLGIPPPLFSQFPSLSPNPAAYADHSSLQFGTSPFAIQDFLPSAATAASPDRDRGRVSKGYIRDLGYSGRDFKLEAERHRDEFRRSRSTNARSSGSYRVSDYTLDSSRPPPSHGNTFGYGLGISDGVTGRRASVDAVGPQSSEFAWAGTVNEVIIKQKKGLQEEESKRKKRSEERKKMKEDSEKKSGLRAAFKRFLF